MCKCANVKMRQCVNVKMCKCENEKTSGLNWTNFTLLNLRYYRDFVTLNIEL
jgi:hypothetical protein